MEVASFRGEDLHFSVQDDTRASDWFPTSVLHQASHSFMNLGWSRQKEECFVFIFPGQAALEMASRIKQTLPVPENVHIKISALCKRITL